MTDQSDTPTKLEITGLVIGVLTFVFSISQSSVRSTNGRVVASSYIDYGAIVGGVLVLIIGVITLITLIQKTSEYDRIKRSVILLVLLTLGIVHLLRGFGIILSPIPPIGSKSETASPISLPIAVPTRTLTTVARTPTLASTTQTPETRSTLTRLPTATIRSTRTVTSTPGAGIVQDVVMTQNVFPGSRMPASPSLVFGQNEKYIHAVVQLVNVDQARNIQATWLYVAVPGKLPNSPLGQSHALAQPGESPYLDFWISPTNPLPEGTYAVEIHVDDVLARRANFAVSRYAAATATDVPLRLIPTPPFRTFFAFAPDAVIAKDVAPNTYEPMGVTQTFSPDQKTIHAVIRLDKAPPLTSLKIIWSVLPSSYYASFSSFSESSQILSKEYTGYADFFITAETPSPEGLYRADIYVNSQVAYVLDFKVNK